ncbi:hypothetical protein [Deinococcus roseus]|uniref:Uncharacterized protein n=1 Tax=Deinococcus roseus TaxID=392414 RepID=A0ABQ2DFA0_9DEIO|nr:hypothetical protein [Deinococcus roseus]GGJ55234.1 hypothetical protein GCM10008938_46720 [Deinococcus roseus]
MSEPTETRLHHCIGRSVAVMATQSISVEEYHKSLDTLTAALVATGVPVLSIQIEVYSAGLQFTFPEVLPAEVQEQVAGFYLQEDFPVESIVLFYLVHNDLDCHVWLEHLYPQFHLGTLKEGEAPEHWIML